MKTRLLSKIKANNLYLYLFVLVTTIFILYLVIYFMYINTLSRLHTVQTKKWIIEMTDNIILGVKNRSNLYKVQQTKIYNISFYYNYFFFHTKKYTLYTLFNLNNKLSNSVVLNVYLYNFEKNATEQSQITLNFDEMKTTKEGNDLIIQLGKSYMQRINMITNKMEVYVNSPNINYSFELYIDDYTTNQPTFIPRYDYIKNISRPYNPITSTPGEWCSDNPMIGKIINGKLNSEHISGGNFWFDNYIGVNDHFLSSYIWNVILNDDWLIYVLWFGEYENQNKTVCFIIKDRKTDTVIRSGFGEGAIPSYFKPLNNLIDPIKSDYTTNKEIGAIDYDNFTSYFETNEISVKFDSIKGESHRVFLYDYYKDKENKHYDNKLEIINNYKYVEYVNMVNIEIKYNNKTVNFKERCVIDAMFKVDKNLPNSF